MENPESFLKQTYAQQLLDRLNYHKSLQSSENAIKYLNKLNSKLNDNNILTHAYLASNPAISEEERKIYLECLKVKAQTEYEIYSNEINKIKERKQLSDSL